MGASPAGGERIELGDGDDDHARAIVVGQTLERSDPC